MMETEAHKQHAAAPKHRGSGCLIWPGRAMGSLLIIVIVLALVGSAYESRAEAADALAYPAPGQMVDVGGYRLHINCTGTGSPTVVIDAGLGDWSTLWGDVQADVAKTTRICTYDRAGMGWSEPGPLPRDAKQFAKELHTLLHNAGIEGPYVMAGHSMGGLTVLVFAREYPSEVAGIVMIDSMTPEQFTVHPADAESQMVSPEHAFSVSSALARIGVVRVLARPLGLVPAGAHDESAYVSRVVRPRNLQAFDDEMQGMPRSGVQAGAVESFGDLPLIVLTARQNQMEKWQQRQTDLLRLSSNSQQLFADSDHNIHMEQPQAAAAAIVQMVEQVREAGIR
jgi:pimeloyl-ACP methyl ester carboxylesterase